MGGAYVPHFGMYAPLGIAVTAYMPENGAYDATRVGHRAVLMGVHDR